MLSPKIRVMLADDDQGLLAALADSVRAAGDLDLVATASDAPTAIAREAAESPDVVVLDVRMPGGGGVFAAREVLKRRPQARVVALSAHEDSASALQMIEAGAIAYVVKGALEADIIDAIRRAHHGQMSISAELGSSMFHEMIREVRERRQTEQSLRKSDERSTAILESVPDAMAIVDQR